MHLGSEVLNTQRPQTIASVRVYPGANGKFTPFQDDGHTYNYEKTGGTITDLTWNDRTHKLQHQGAPAWSGSDSSVVNVIR